MWEVPDLIKSLISMTLPGISEEAFDSSFLTHFLLCGRLYQSLRTLCGASGFLALFSRSNYFLPHQLLAFQLSSKFSWCRLLQCQGLWSLVPHANCQPPGLLFFPSFATVVKQLFSNASLLRNLLTLMLVLVASAWSFYFNQPFAFA